MLYVHIHIIRCKEELVHFLINHGVYFKFRTLSIDKLLNRARDVRACARDHSTHYSIDMTHFLT